jgi:hypothetical protein
MSRHGCDANDAGTTNHKGPVNCPHLQSIFNSNLHAWTASRIGDSNSLAVTSSCNIVAKLCWEMEMIIFALPASPILRSSTGNAGYRISKGCGQLLVSLSRLRKSSHRTDSAFMDWNRPLAFGEISANPKLTSGTFEGITLARCCLWCSQYSTGSGVIATACPV